MLQNIIQLKGIKKITKQQQKSIMAGSNSIDCPELTVSAIETMHEECWNGNVGAYRTCMFCRSANACGQSCA
ncbi:hypothetical protein [Aquimarina sp. 2201CG5-10]|uniref:hypothetical protein n=1 Tax=Aquimarina callyspongiae TaxID=3098150 RepID=UPI002AB5DAE1|nr:hypothetical protein [Aquimarina sp. 2201CG5-10]MDY8136984.1 hypothetical protein [Aquimarina sp. 2201CG5-10]